MDQDRQTLRRAAAQAFLESLDELQDSLNAEAQSAAPPANVTLKPVPPPTAQQLSVQAARVAKVAKSPLPATPGTPATSGSAEGGGEGTVAGGKDSAAQRPHPRPAPAKGPGKTAPVRFTLADLEEAAADIEQFIRAQHPDAKADEKSADEK